MPNGEKDKTWNTERKNKQVEFEISDTSSSSSKCKSAAEEHLQYCKVKDRNGGAGKVGSKSIGTWGLTIQMLVPERSLNGEEWRIMGSHDPALNWRWEEEESPKQATVHACIYTCSPPPSLLPLHQVAKTLLWSGRRMVLAELKWRWMVQSRPALHVIHV